MTRIDELGRCVMLAVASGLLGCAGGAEAPTLLVGREPADAGGDGAQPEAGPPRPGLTENPLQVSVEDAQGMTVEVITLACRGDCADLLAVAKGGTAPYEFTWEDGTQGAARTVCLDDSTTLRVEARDSGLDAGEFQQPVLRAEAEVSATVVGCGDDSLCLRNPSFEGTATTIPEPLCLPPVSPLPSFEVCDCSPDVGPSLLTWRAAAHGATYMGFLGNGPDTGEAWGSELCAPLEAGSEVPFTVQVSATDVSDEGFMPGRVQLWGGAGPCAMDELLWQSDPIAPQEDWRKACGVLRPTADYTHVVFRAVTTEPPDGGTAYLNVDDFVVGRPSAFCSE